MTLRELANTQWVGRGELWLDPLGNNADICECSIEIQEAAIHYRWSYDDKPQTGGPAGRLTGR